METIDRYVLEEELGSGGFGKVYRARHQILGREVALKVLLVAHEKERFFREAEVLAQLDHPNVVQVHDCGSTDEGQAFLALELLEGETLAQRLQRTGAQPLTEALWIADGILQGLAAAHAVGVVHRDLKHPNIFLAQTTDGPVVKLLDFGIAKVGGASALTAPGMLMGTPRYMAPEQVQGGQADARSDVWSTAIVLYEMLTGSLAYGGTPEEALIAIATGAPPPIQRRAPDVPPAVADAIATALSHDPAGRYASADAFRAALRLASKSRTVPGVVSREFATGVLDALPDALTDAPASPTRGSFAPAPTSPTDPASSASPTEVASPAPPSRRAWMAIALVLLLAAVAGGSLWLGASSEEPQGVTSASRLLAAQRLDPRSSGPLEPATIEAGLPRGSLPPELEPPGGVGTAVGTAGHTVLTMPRRSGAGEESGPTEPAAEPPSGPMPAHVQRALAVQRMVNGQDEAALQAEAERTLRAALDSRATLDNPNLPASARREIEAEIAHATETEPRETEAGPAPTRSGRPLQITCEPQGFSPGVTAAHTGQIARALASANPSCDLRGELQFTFVMGRRVSITRASGCALEEARRLVGRVDGLRHAVIRCTIR